VINNHKGLPLLPEVFALIPASFQRDSARQNRTPFTEPFEQFMGVLWRFSEPNRISCILTPGPITRDICCGLAMCSRPLVSHLD
jgi:hypothetical protein